MLRFGLPALVVLALVVIHLLWSTAGPPVVDAADLAADPGARRGSEIVVIGEWLTAAPCAQGYMVVVLRGRDGGRVACHFEDVPERDRGGLEARLVPRGEVAVRGRGDGVAGDAAVLRNCRLLD